MSHFIHPGFITGTMGADLVLAAVLIVVVVLLAALVSNFKVVPQAHAYVVERLGAFHSAWTTGLHFKIPFIDRIAKKVSLKEQVIDFPPQPVITKDNVTMQIDTVVYFQITVSICMVTLSLVITG